MSGGTAATASAAPTSPCNLGPGGNIHHVVYVQFDNFHLLRDNPNVPSDLEQIPALKSYLTSRGTLDSNDHTILISHTAGGIISSLTGLYPDRNGINVSNSYGVFKPDGSIDTPNATAFTYWTDAATTNDPLPNLITDGQKNTPAPWAPYTRAGCDVGAFSLANMEIENLRTTGNAGDISKVFGTPSPEVDFANSSAPTARKVADFEGIAIHCSQADSAAGRLCQPSSGGVAYGGRPDSLPDEPGGYSGFNGLFGGAYANQVISNPGSFVPSTSSGTTPGFNDLAPPVNDVFDFSHTKTPATCTVDGGPCPAPTPLQNAGNNGFPNTFNPNAAQTLGYTAAMQEAGIPVTFAYIADAHDRHDTTGACADAAGALGPGSACYEQQLHEYDQAFQAYFQRLAADGINKSNTLFVFTVEEGDHYDGGPPTNTGCDGVATVCNYTPGTVGPNTVGEVQVNLQHLIQSQTGNGTAFDYHFDSAPTIYVHNDPNGPPGPTDSKVRDLQRAISGLTIANPRTGNTDSAVQHVADQTTQDILHMTNTDPLRTPSFTMFGNADYFFTGQQSCSTPPPSGSSAGCPGVNTNFAWNHGDDNPEIGQTWLGLVGPSIQNLGQTGATWTDHTDVLPTMLSVLGLSPGYAPDGNVYSQAINPSALPAGVRAKLGTFQQLNEVLKQLNAPFGQFGHDAEVVSTTAVKTTDSATYDQWTTQLAACRDQRNAVAGQIQSMLNGATFNGASIAPNQAGKLVGKANSLITKMHDLSGESTPPQGSMVCG